MINIRSHTPDKMQNEKKNKAVLKGRTGFSYIDRHFDTRNNGYKDYMKANVYENGLKVDSEKDKLIYL